MNAPNDRLRELLQYLNLTSLSLAKALYVDPSVVSRWLSGQRRLLFASPQMEALAGYVLERCQTMRDVEWLQARFEEAGLSNEITTVRRIRQNLMLYLATDGETQRKKLADQVVDRAPSGARDGAPEETTPEDGLVLTGYPAIALALREAFSTLARGETVRLFLSSDRLRAPVKDDLAELINRTALERDVHFEMTVGVSGDTQAIHELMSRYLSTLISGHVRLCSAQGLTQPITGTLHLLLPGGPCFVLHEALGADVPPVAVVIRGAAFPAEIARSFEAAARYAQPILRLYGDECTREIIEILAIEYCAPGGLDVVKDSVNPMFMTPEKYDRFLRTLGYAPEEFAWRSAEFRRFKAGMDESMRAGSPFREILSLARLNDIAREGSCRMAGLYFAGQGYLALDAQGCADTLRGYLRYLDEEPNFHLLVLDGLSALHGNNCWHIKRDAHVTVNNWQGKAPVMLYSDRLMMMREFQARFDALWVQGEGGVGSRANVICILRDVLCRLEKKHG